jgi:hypothetical protein
MSSFNGGATKSLSKGEIEIKARDMGMQYPSNFKFK